MKTKYHLSVNIRGLLENGRRKSLAGVVLDDNGKHMTDAQARDYLYQCLGEGKLVLPAADCDEFDFVKGCPGHKVE
jgi:hypothetical protein